MHHRARARSCYCAVTVTTWVCVAPLANVATIVIAYEVPDVTEIAVLKDVLVPTPGAMGVVEDGGGFQVTLAGTTLPEMERPVSAIEPELVTETTAVPVPEPLGTAMDALTWIWAVFCALVAVVLKYV